jgi:hypothetical protein
MAHLHPSLISQSGAIVALCWMARAACAQPLEWTTFTDPNGTTIPFPRGLFSVRTDPGAGEPPGSAFTTRDGRARLQIFTLRNERNESPAQFLRRLFPKDRVGALTYSRVTRRFFVVSEPKDGRVLYRRCNFPDDGYLHCFEMSDPLAEKRAFDDIVTRVSLSMRPQ